MTQYKYNSADPIKIRLADVDDRKRFLLSESKTFCMYPWIHLHAYPTGEAWPCCHAEMAAGPIGSCRENTLKEVWNSERMKELRRDMLTETKNSYCTRCYEQEEAGFFSGRQSANKHHGHHIDRVDATTPAGDYDEFQMTYWDIRFSNLCNLSCRSCGHIFSSSWYQDQAKLAGGDWAQRNKVLNYAGRTETDIWEQLVPHLDYVEQIYFAGGEPLMMEEHYNILEELERRGRFDVRLIYNTNFTHVKLKDRYVFDYWKKFKSVAVGASLDASGPRGEYIRKGTKWSVVEENRRQMLEVCPEVDFYISPTLSIMNAWHLPDFHRDWVEKGLLTPQDLNVNVLQDPAHYRVDIAPMKYKQRLRVKFEEHLEWLRPYDKLGRATQGFESVINFMMGTDNTALIPKFWAKTQQLDEIRNEKLLDIIPELEALR
jgi:MoaA/NifB/PqqE/SkfB family radical SAM enzyme